MPLHSYRCNDCGAVIEALVRAGRPGPSECARCGGAGLTRQMAAFAVARSELDAIRALDPMYRRMVDDQMAKTPEAEPMRHLAKLTPFDAASDPGAPIDF